MHQAFYCQVSVYTCESPVLLCLTSTQFCSHSYTYVHTHLLQYRYGLLHYARGSIKSMLGRNSVTILHTHNYGNVTCTMHRKPIKPRFYSWDSLVHSKWFVGDWDQITSTNDHCWVSTCQWWYRSCRYVEDMTMEFSKCQEMELARMTFFKNTLLRLKETLDTTKKAM